VLDDITSRAPELDNAVEGGLRDVAAMKDVGEVEESTIPELDCSKLDLRSDSMVHGGDEQ
jgi:hypothetical protein